VRYTVFRKILQLVDRDYSEELREHLRNNAYPHYEDRHRR
jgi:hypothetical protein